MSQTKVAKVIADALLDLAGSQGSWFDDADKLLSALRSAGFAVVPVEPTLEMIAAWDRVARPGLHAFEARYKAMITAAQEDSRDR